MPQPVGVSHLLVLGQQKDQVNLRVARLPGGPTFIVQDPELFFEEKCARSRSAPSEVRLPTLLRHSSCWTASGARRSTSLCRGSRSRLLFAPIVDVSTVKVADMRRVVLFHQGRRRRRDAPLCGASFRGERLEAGQTSGGGQDHSRPVEAQRHLGVRHQD